MPKVQCEKSPDGKHEPETGEIVVKGKVKIVKVCRWCGKNMGK